MIDKLPHVSSAGFEGSAFEKLALINDRFVLPWSKAFGQYFRQNQELGSRENGAVSKVRL